MTDWNFPTGEDGGLDPTLAFVDGATEYVQDVARRLNTGLGMLWYDPLFGLYTNGIRDILNESGPDLGEVSRDIATQVRHDPRTESVAVAVTTEETRNGLHWSIDIKAKMRNGQNVRIPLTIAE